MVFEDHKIPEIIREDKETNTDDQAPPPLIKEDKDVNTEQVHLKDREVLTDAYIIEPEKIIEYIPSPPKESTSQGIQVFFQIEEEKAGVREPERS